MEEVIAELLPATADVVGRSQPEGEVVAMVRGNDAAALAQTTSACSTRSSQLRSWLVSVFAGSNSLRLRRLRVLTSAQVDGRWPVGSNW